MSKATHNGTCQVCGRTHAVNNKTTDLAKHGYTVQFNYFRGTCKGSDNSPLEISKVLTLETIKDCLTQAKRLNAVTPDQINLIKVIVKVRCDEDGWYAGAWEKKEVMMNATEWEAHRLSLSSQYSGYLGNSRTFEDAQERAVSALKREAAFLIDHAGMLEFRIETHHGQPLQRRDSNIDRIKETFDSMPAAYARAEELKLEGWKARVCRRNYDRHTTLTATR